MAVADDDLMSFPVTVKSPLTVVVVAVIAIVPSVAFEIVSLFPKTKSFPVTVRSVPTVRAALVVVVVAVIATVPSLEFEIVSPLPKVTSFPVTVISPATVVFPLKSTLKASEVLPEVPFPITKAVFAVLNTVALLVTEDPEELY